MSDIYGILHCHTDHSVKDCPIKIEDLCKRAKDLGVNAIAITDHGTCTGWIAFKECCEKYGIKPVLGVEAYIKTAYAPYAHLILMAKNYQGYQEISHAITEANNNLVNIGDGLVHLNKILWTRECNRYNCMRVWYYCTGLSSQHTN